jgi:inorganic pyrophosphatase
MEGKYMDTKDYLGRIIKIKIDRQFGSKHPKHGFIYPVNYGYVPNTISGDGEELDAYLLGVFEPVTEFEGECIAIIHRTNDDDDKLVVVPKGKYYSDDAINALTEFQEQYFEHIIIRKEEALIK